LPTPKPGPGQALVRIEAAGVNFIDVYQRSGLYKGELPLRLGLEAGGVVEEVGAGVSTAGVNADARYNSADAYRAAGDGIGER